MSSSEIADNKWELQAAKPPVGSASGIMQLTMMGGFVLMFGWLILYSIIGAVTPKNEESGLANSYKNMKAEVPAAEAPKAEAE
jgi:hypothetical protein